MFDPKWINLDALDVCDLMGSTVKGGLGPFGFATLASQKLEEYTPVFFRVFKAQEKLKVLMCSDAKRYSLYTYNFILLICLYKSNWFMICLYKLRSSTGEGLYKPSFAGFVDVDLSHKKISLRSLVCMCSLISRPC